MEDYMVLGRVVGASAFTLGQVRLMVYYHQVPGLEFLSVGVLAVDHVSNPLPTQFFDAPDSSRFQVHLYSHDGLRAMSKIEPVLRGRDFEADWSLFILQAEYELRIHSRSRTRAGSPLLLI